MPARDIYHNHVRQALIKDGWAITDDPLKLLIGGRDLYVDLGAERLLAAERAGRRIAVEVKSFVSKSPVADLEEALGQYTLYHDILLDTETEADRILYLALRRSAFKALFEEPIGQVLLKNNRLRLLVFDPRRKEIVQWIPQP